METSGNDEKFPFGPIIDPRPGPTFDIEVAAPDIEVSKSSPLKDNKAELVDANAAKILIDNWFNINK